MSETGPDHCNNMDDEAEAKDTQVENTPFDDIIRICKQNPRYYFDAMTMDMYVTLKHLMIEARGLHSHRDQLIDLATVLIEKLQRAREIARMATGLKELMADTDACDYAKECVSALADMSIPSEDVLSTTLEEVKSSSGSEPDPSYGSGAGPGSSDESRNIIVTMKTELQTYKPMMRLYWLVRETLLTAGDATDLLEYKYMTELFAELGIDTPEGFKAYFNDLGLEVPKEADGSEVNPVSVMQEIHDIHAKLTDWARDFVTNFKTSIRMTAGMCI